MKKIKSILVRNSKVISTVSSMALFFSVIAANTYCCAIFHQPDKPELKKLRKF